MNDPRIPAAVRHIATEAADTCPEVAFDDQMDFPLTSDAPDTVLDRLPGILRVQSLTRLLERDRILNRAILCHRRTTLCVDWVSTTVDTRLHRGSLVSIKRADHVRCHDGALRIQRLLPVPCCGMGSACIDSSAVPRPLAVTMPIREATSATVSKSPSKPGPWGRRCPWPMCPY